MTHIQLELNFFNDNAEALKFQLMQKQIEAMHESNGKVRRKIFAKLGEMETLLSALQEENNELKAKVRELTNEKTEWVYGQGGYLFDVREHQKAAC